MRRPSARCTPNRVTITRASFTVDAAGGRVPGGYATTPEIACTVQATSEEDVPYHAREAEIVYLTVIFHDGNPNLAPRDKLTWVDGGNQILTVTAMSNAGGRGASWPVLTQYRPVKA